jgi:small GTP-binding protein
MAVHEIKFVLLGASGVGKSSIFRRLLNNTFSAQSESTLGAAYVELYIAEDADGGLRVVSTRGAAPSAHRMWKVHIWDTAGQERYRSLLPMYYRGANVVSIVHDGTHPAITSAKQSLTDLEDAWKTGNTVLAMCQNKSDLPGATLHRELANDPRVVYSDMVSARTGDKVHRFFVEACRPYIAFRNRTRGLTDDAGDAEDPLLRLDDNVSVSRCCG